MLEISQLLEDKTEKILDKWMEKVRQDRRIESALELSDTALGDSIPKLLPAMVSLLTPAPENDESEIVLHASLEHGVVRAQQGYDSAEIAREYAILRQVIFSFLETKLLEKDPSEIIKTFYLIDRVLDEAIEDCFQSYVEERLDELQQLRRQLILTNKELTRLLRSSKETLSYIAHEVKNPLTSIIGYSELFLRQHQKDTQSGDHSANLNHIEKVVNNGRQLLRLVNDALELSRYEAGKIELHPVTTDLRDAIAEAVEQIKPLAQAKNLRLEINCDRAPDQVFTDPFRLQQILTNLLGNAVRYTDTGMIHLECHTLSHEKWCISITDTGLGISPEDQTHIFEPYFQAKTKRMVKIGEGMGLGLAIVSRFVKLLQGEIHCVSQLGVGSTFTVTFPLTLQT